ncbi:MAG: response regulator [Acidaminobacteraceae bacterium]
MIPKRILIVEDSPTVIQQMKLMLSEYDIKISTAGSEFGMLQHIEEYGKLVDLIIMDLSLKSENGLDLIDNLRKNLRFSTIPIIVVTEHAEKDFILRAKGLNVAEYIRKPFTKDTLISRISNVIEI